jgi:alpha-tubulin suppressor-like RCC1 family protein
MTAGLRPLARSLFATVVFVALAALSREARAGASVVQLVSGGDHYCALLSDQSVRCWGLNDVGQLGNPTNAGLTVANPKPLVALPAGSTVVQLAAGLRHTCALHADSSVRAGAITTTDSSGNRRP